MRASPGFSQILLNFFDSESIRGIKDNRRINNV